MDKALCEFKYSTTADNVSKTVCIKINILDFKRVMEYPDTKKFGVTKANFPAEADPDIKFGVTINVTGKERDLLEICYLAPAPAFFVAHCYVLDRNGSRSNQPVAIRYDRSALPEPQLLAVLLRHDLYNSIITSPHQISGRLCFEFLFIINKTIPIMDEYKSVPTNLMNNLADLLKHATLSDVVIKSLEGIELSAHKSILIARSDVLKAHFEHGTTETETNIIGSDFEADVLQEVLHYIYTDRPPLKIEEMPDKILFAADFYHLDGLKVLCEKTLYEQLSVENALKTLQIADLHSLSDLKRLSLKFINNGHLKSITATEEWKSFKSVELIKSICEFKCM